MRQGISGNLPDILCEQHERKVYNDNCVHFEGLSLQISADEFRYHYVRTTVRVHRYVDATLAVFHGPRKLAAYDAKGLPANAREVQRRLAWGPQYAQRDGCKAASGYALHCFAAVAFQSIESRQSICYQTGQFYLLLTAKNTRVSFEAALWPQVGQFFGRLQRSAVAVLKFIHASIRQPDLISIAFTLYRVDSWNQ